MKARMESGYWIHNPPIGYRYEKVRGRGRMLFANPPFDDIVREAFEGYANCRFGSQAEAKRFFESFSDFPRNTRGGIVQRRVTDILTQPVYTGHFRSETYGIRWLKAQHEPLLSLETFGAVQKRRSSTARAPRRKNIGRLCAPRNRHRRRLQCAAAVFDQQRERGALLLLPLPDQNL
ncbi:MAG: recombinase family protein [Pseudomonadota bacterium]